MLNLLMSRQQRSGTRPTRWPAAWSSQLPRRRELWALMISDEREVALDPAQQRDQGGGLLVSQITPENGVKGLRDHPISTSNHGGADDIDRHHHPRDPGAIRPR
jgi:hypothetical protein